MGIVCKPPLIGIIKKTVANKKTGACIQFPLVIFSLFLWMVFLNILINAYEAINQKIRPEYTIARLFHPEYDLVTNSVKADYNKRDNSYYAIFDLGDPDTILPYSAKYTGKIFVADSILERSLLYTFGTFDILSNTIKKWTSIE